MDRLAPGNSESKTESEDLKQFKAEIARLKAEREEVAKEMRIASGQIAAAHIVQVQKEAQELADNLRELEDGQARDRLEMRRNEIDLSWEFSENYNMRAIVEGESGAPKQSIDKICKDFNFQVTMLGRNFTEVLNMVNLAVRMKKPSFAHGNVKKAQMYISNTIKNLTAIRPLLVEFARHGLVDEHFEQRIQALQQIQENAFQILSDIGTIENTWNVENADEEWLKILETQVKNVKNVVDNLIKNWKDVQAIKK